MKFCNPNPPDFAPLFIFDRFRHGCPTKETIERYLCKFYDLEFADCSTARDELIARTPDGWFIFRTLGFVDPCTLWKMDMVKKQ
jgi:hypothetical protein